MPLQIKIVPLQKKIMRLQKKIVLNLTKKVQTSYRQNYRQNYREILQRNIIDKSNRSQGKNFPDEWRVDFDKLHLKNTCISLDWGV